MDRRPYVPSGKSDSGALLVVLGATLGAAVLAGLLEGFVSQWFSLLLIFPLALGLAVGGVGHAFVTSRRVRNPLAVALIGVAMGLTAQALVHVVDYERARSTVAAAIERDPAAAPFVQEHGIDASVDAAFAGEDGKEPFLGYLAIAAAHGITITHAGGGSSSGPTLTGLGAYALWLVELAVAAGVGAWMMASQAREPFCEPCNAWYATEEIVAAGAGEPKRAKATAQRLESGRLVDAVSELGESDGKSLSMLVLRGCSKCKGHEPLLELRRVTGIGKKQETKKVFATLLSQSEAEELRAARSAARPAVA